MNEFMCISEISDEPSLKLSRYLHFRTGLDICFLHKARSAWLNRAWFLS